MPLALIAIYLLCADAILLAEGIGSSLLIVVLAVIAAVVATIGYGGGLTAVTRRGL